MLWGIATAFFFQRVFPVSSFFALGLTISCYISQKIRLSKLSKRPNYHTEDVGRSSLFVLNMLPGVYGAGLMVWDNAMVNKIDPLTWFFCAYGLVIIFYPPYVQLTKWKAFQRFVRRFLKLGECEVNDFSKRSLRDYFMKTRKTEAKKIWQYNLGQGPMQLYQLTKKLEELNNNINSSPAPIPVQTTATNAQAGKTTPTPGAQSVGQNSGIQTPNNEPAGSTGKIGSGKTTAKFTQAEVKKFRKDKLAVENQIEQILVEMRKNADRFKELGPYERYNQAPTVAITPPIDPNQKATNNKPGQTPVASEVKPQKVRFFDQDEYLIRNNKMQRRDPQTLAESSMKKSEGVIGDFGLWSTTVPKDDPEYQMVTKSRIRLWKQIELSCQITDKRMKLIVEQSRKGKFSEGALITRYDDLVNDFDDIKAEAQIATAFSTMKIKGDEADIKSIVDKRSAPNAKNPFGEKYKIAKEKSDKDNTPLNVSQYFDFTLQKFDVLYEVGLEKLELQKSAYTDGAYAHYMEFEKPIVPFSEMKKHFVLSYERVNPVTSDEATTRYLRDRSGKFRFIQNTG